jgi:hypothetical protein
MFSDLAELFWRIMCDMLKCDELLGKETELDKPNEVIVDKACALWAEMLSNPKFDALGKRDPQGRDDPNGSMAMASIMARGLAKECAATPEQLEKFKMSLKTWLMSKVEFDRDTKQISISDKGWYSTDLDVDYGPDMILRQAATEAGISDNLFPWKTYMRLSETHLSLSYGYGSPRIYYYPTKVGWLLCELYGNDMAKIIEYVEGGKPVFLMTP